MMYLIKICFIFLALITLINCKKENEGHHKEIKTEKTHSELYNDIENVNFSELVDTLTLDSNKLKFLGSLNKKFDSQGLTDDELKELGCYEWTINTENIRNVIPDLTQVSHNEWYMSCSIFPCYYEVDVLVNNKKGKMIVNSAGYFELYIENKSFRYILRKPNKYFLTVCNSELEG